VVVNGNYVVVKDTLMAISVLLATIEVVANSRIMVVVDLLLATTPCVVVRKITTKQIVLSLYF
jgi:hypothetical protein